jgi:hypothetical protein
MSSELNGDQARNPALPGKFKGKTARRAANVDVRLSPLPARNMLLTVLFFSAIAAAILYWIFFPPAAPQASERSPAPAAQSAQRD